MNLKKIGKVFTSKFVGTGPSSYKKRIYRAALSPRLRYTVLACYTEWRRADRHFSERTFALRWWVGGRVCTPRKRWCHAISKPLQWQRIPVVCSVLMSDDNNFHVSGILWPVRSPDLTFPNFFLLGHLKECVYRSHPHTVQEVKRAVRDAIATINRELVPRIIWQFFESFKKICCKWRRPPSSCCLSK